MNLTAAEYVYLLDPWWNPAVEAQAIDRSHRIGQTQHVFAYRLICRGTVEEKILELQQKKRDLADAILAPTTVARSKTFRGKILSSCCRDQKPEGTLPLLSPTIAMIRARHEERRYSE